MKNIKKKTNPTTRTFAENLSLGLIPLILFILFNANSHPISGIFTAAVSCFLLWLFTEPYNLALVVLTEQQKEILRTQGLGALRSDEDKGYRQISFSVVTLNGKRVTLQFDDIRFYPRRDYITELLLADKLCVSYKTASIGMDTYHSLGKIYNLDEISVSFAVPAV